MKHFRAEIDFIRPDKRTDFRINPDTLEKLDIF
jgi:hypothetical protein